MSGAGNLVIMPRPETGKRSINISLLLFPTEASDQLTRLLRPEKLYVAKYQWAGGPVFRFFSICAAGAQGPRYGMLRLWYLWLAALEAFQERVGDCRGLMPRRN